MALEASLCALEGASFLRQDPLDPATWRFCQVSGSLLRTPGWLGCDGGWGFHQADVVACRRHNCHMLVVSAQQLSASDSNKPPFPPHQVLARDVVYEMVPQGVRRDWHAAAAAAMEAYSSGGRGGQVAG